ncbi:alpha/beta hydrolase fold domain-containing protein [Variovorax sp. HJSM1_2]|uniref:alpha/beta hydrolase fold domain-containing protein n=1 Tax=Variovorax sp. HJSM1_2 TaxID=3366263 RepID=UPI003BECF6B7
MSAIPSTTGRKSQEVYQALRRQIVLAERAPGQQLVELDLAKAMGCSQSTVREALMRLKEDGLIVRQGYRGTVVAGVSAAEGQEALDIRARMESRAAYLSIGNFTAEHIQGLRMLVQQMEAVAEAGDEYALFELDQEFHRALYDRANLPALVPILDRCSLSSHRYKITQSTTRRTLRDTALRHWKIIEAVLSGRAAELDRVLFHHVSSVIGEPDDMNSSTPELRMSSSMEAVFLRLQKEDAHLPNPMTIPLAQARLNFNAINERWNRLDGLDVAVEHFTIPSPSGGIAGVRVAPKTGGKPGTLVYLHGGGWVVGNLNTHMGAMARLALATGMVVVGVDYRLAPDAPFPAGLNDAVRAWHWLRTEQAGLRLGAPWVVSGDSAGANIALSLMLDLRHAGEVLPHAALLFYGVFSADHQTESHMRCGGGQFGLSSEKMAWYRAHYLSGERNDANDPRVSPLLADVADLAGLPPIYLNAAGLDPLRDDSVALARRLEAAKVPTRLKIFDGVVHGFMQMGSELPEARAAFDDAAAYLRTL